MALHALCNRFTSACILGHGARRFITKTQRVMQLTAILLTVCTIGATARSVSQSITFSGTNVPLEQVFAEIKKQTHYLVFTNQKLLRNTQPVTIDAKNMPLDNFLTAIFKDQPLTYSIQNTSITIKAKTATLSPQLDADAPPITVRGKIVNEKGEPVVASVIIKGTNRGVTSNADGSFEIFGVDEDAVLLISAANIETQEIKINKRPDVGLLSVVMKVESMNEVVINKGYYTEKQKYSVGNVGRVDAKDIEKQPVQNPLLALQGRVTGLEVTQATGVPGGGIKIRIQGQNSINDGNNEPLIVVDGVQYPGVLPVTGSGNSILGTSGGGGRGNPLNYINPSDIGSIEVLKDADATAIYGSLGSNGVILITTKKAKAGKMKLDVNLQQGFSQVAKKLDVLNSRQYLDMRYEALKNDGIDLNTVSATSSRYYDLKVWDTTRYTDWQKELIGGTAQYTNVYASASGGSATMQYIIGATYNRQTTVFPGDFDDNRLAMHLNLNSNSANKKFRMELTANYMIDHNRLPNIDLTQSAITLEPVAPSLFNPDGTLNWAQTTTGTSTWQNPLQFLYNKYKIDNNSLVSNFRMSYKILPGLEISNSFGYTILQTDDLRQKPYISVRPERRIVTEKNTAAYGVTNSNSLIVEPQVNFNRLIGKGTFKILIGSTLRQNTDKLLLISGSDFLSDEQLENVVSAATTTLAQSFSKYKYAALFGRFNYNLNNKYIVNLTARRDGSSRFGEKNRFANFWAAGVGYIFTEESLFSQINSIMDFGKLRASYGITGNDGIGNYGFLSLYNNIGSSTLYQSTTGLRVRGLTNPYLQWEETKKLQLGIDLGFLQDRIYTSITYSRNRCSNQLLDYPLPYTTGFNSISQNLPSTVQNTTWELSLNTINVKTKIFSWTTTMNLSIPRNKLVKFENIEKTVYANSLIVGEPLSLVRMYDFAGVDPATGLYQYKSANGQLTSSPITEDLLVKYHTFSKFYGGIQNNFSYKGVDVDVFFQIINQVGRVVPGYYSLGNYGPGYFQSGVSNQPASVLNRWQGKDDVAPIQKFSTDLLTALGVSTAAAADLNKGNATFIRLKNVTVSWELPNIIKNKIGITSCRLFLLGQNILTFSKYPGLDPETQSVSVLPPLRTYVAGVKLSL
jgi:TonB-dependent starch-binding outer membrane protein SusC